MPVIVFNILQTGSHCSCFLRPSCPVESASSPETAMLEICHDAESRDLFVQHCFGRVQFPKSAAYLVTSSHPVKGQGLRPSSDVLERELPGREPGEPASRMWHSLVMFSCLL